MPTDHLTLELFAAPVILAGGVLLHFAFQWSGRQRWVAIIALVNESRWEHVKMAYWPAVAFTAVQVIVTGPAVSGLLTAKTIGFAVTAGLMLGLDSLSGVVTHRTSAGEVLIHTVTFASAVLIGQLVCYAIQRWSSIGLGAAPGIVLLSVPAVTLALMTFFPPRTPLFRDQLTGGYGIASH
jgi:hypothetical protein